MKARMSDCDDSGDANHVTHEVVTVPLGFSSDASSSASLWSH